MVSYDMKEKDWVQAAQSAWLQDLFGVHGSKELEK